MTSTSVDDDVIVEETIDSLTPIIVLSSYVGKSRDEISIDEMSILMARPLGGDIIGNTTVN